MNFETKAMVIFLVVFCGLVSLIYAVSGTDFLVVPGYFSNRKIRALEIRLERIEKVLGIRDQVSSCIPSLEEQERMRGF